MKLIVDAFGGDNAPLEIIKGCELAVKEYGYEIVLVGDEEKIRDCTNNNNVSLQNMEIVHATETISMEDHPDCILKEKKDSSMAKGMQLLASGEGDAFVTAGSTGAAVIGSTFLVKRIKGHSAAKSVHHGFVGGLLEHTLSVAKICDCFAGLYPVMNRDLLVTAAIIH